MRDIYLNKLSEVLPADLIAEVVEGTHDDQLLIIQQLKHSFIGRTDVKVYFFPD